MPPRKATQDHLPKTNTHGPHTAASLDELDEYWSFEANGKTYVMPNKTLDIITTGYIRKNRRLDDMDYVLTAVETLIGARDINGNETDPGKEGKAILDAFDSLNRDQLLEAMKSFQEHIGATLGE